MSLNENPLLYLQTIYVGLEGAIPRNKFDAIEWKIEHGRLQLDKLTKMKPSMVRIL